MRIETAAPQAVRQRPNPRLARPQAGSRGWPRLAMLFVLSLLVPVILNLGPIRLLPHRAFLLVAFLPLVAMLVSGRAGRLVAADYLILGSVIWAALALFVSWPGPGVIEPIGIYVVEFLGAYLLGRLAIRSAQDFRLFVKFFLGVILILLPFAALEAFLHRPILLELFPSSYYPVEAGGPRWGLRRAQVVFAHPILYGAFVSTGLGLCWYAFKPSAGLVTRMMLVFPVVCATFFSLSSGAMVALVIQTGLIAWDLAFRGFSNRWKVLGWLSAAAYIFLDAASNRTPFHLLVDYATFNSGTAYTRIVIWRWGIDNVWANPVFGLGMGIADWERASWLGGSIDNYWLMVAMQYGVPSFLMLALAIFMMVRRTTQAALVDPLDRASRTGYLVALSGLIIAGGTVHYWQAMLAFLMFMVGAGMWMSTGGAAPPAAEKKESRRKRGSRPASTDRTGMPAPLTEAQPRAGRR
jgi:hypothetical protein